MWQQQSKDRAPFLHSQNHDCISSGFYGKLYVTTSDCSTYFKPERLEKTFVVIIFDDPVASLLMQRLRLPFAIITIIRERCLAGLSRYRNMLQ